MRNIIIAVILIVVLATSSVSLIVDVPEEEIEEENTPSIAYVVPTFTYTAYADNAFYEGYRGYHNNTLDGEDLVDFFSVEYKRQYRDYDYTIADDLGSDAILTSVDIHEGNFFDYDLVIFQHEEYVTEQMYLNYIEYVEGGGKVLFLDGNMFFAEISFNGSHIELIEGHNFRKINDQKYGAGKWDRFLSNNLYDQRESENDLGSFESPKDTWSYDYIGSTYRASIYKEGTIYANISQTHVLSSKLKNFQYKSHEENTMINPNAKIIFTTNFKNPDMGINAYTLQIGNGEILYTGMFASYIIDDVLDILLIFKDYLL